MEEFDNFITEMQPASFRMKYNPNTEEEAQTIRARVSAAQLKKCISRLY
jgi:hypothetical protein